MGVNVRVGVLKLQEQTANETKMIKAKVMPISHNII